MKPGTIAALIVIIVALAGLVLFAGSDSETNDNDTTQSAAQSANEQNDSEGAVQSGDDSNMIITQATVAEHAAEDDCWTIVNGMVYDITSYVPRHPGGDEILLACGSDGTTLFTQRQTENGDAVGTGEPHSSDANSLLDSFKVGELAN